ncbi:ATP-binding protein [Kineococcus sp. LSe6-4]|uniref:ATP-binding protein n=1 Tax=Kineococcus halophytocola TaxID=3234027 RepID=A0ABV4GZ72_9ACTN
MSARGVRRLLALVLALAVLSVAPTVATTVAGGRGNAPAVWTVPVLAGYGATLALLARQAVQRHGPAPGADGPTVSAWVLVVLGDVALATYPLVVHGPEDDVPWVLSLSPVTVGAGAVAVSSVTGALALAAVHLALRAALQLSGVWTVPPDVGALEATGLVVIAVAAAVAVLAVRGSARQLDAARAAAARAAAGAAAAEAVEQENSRWDGIVHDDVLASLSLAAHARDDTDRLHARQAAGRALTSVVHEPDGGTGPGRPVPVADAVHRLGEAVAAELPAADLRPDPDRSRALVPAEALEALRAATVEACRNARRHGAREGVAPGVRVRVRVRSPGPDGPGRLSVEVRDDGAGFDPRRASPRLGLDVSVRRRAAVVGGRALVRSAPGVGTVVLLSVPVLDPAGLPGARA